MKLHEQTRESTNKSTNENKKKSQIKKSQKILILCAIKEELLPLIKQWSCIYKHQYLSYQSQEQDHIFMKTIGVGFKKKKELLYSLQQIQPRYVINVGLVGALHSSSNKNFKIGKEALISQICLSKNLKENYNKSLHKNHNKKYQFQEHEKSKKKESKENIEVFTINPLSSNFSNEQDLSHSTTNTSVPREKKYRLVCVSRPIFSLHEKLELAQNHDAHFCDMESIPLFSFIKEYNKESHKECNKKFNKEFNKEYNKEFNSSHTKNNKIQFYILKIIGDTPKEANLFCYEFLLRQWYQLNAYQKFIKLLRYSHKLHILLLLLYYKKTALNELSSTLRKKVEQLS